MLYINLEIFKKGFDLKKGLFKKAPFWHNMCNPENPSYMCIYPENWAVELIISKEFQLSRTIKSKNMEQKK